MDLEVVGRHALLFDDDAMSAFVNSGDALVDWNSLQIDRYDVRHLLSSPPPPRRRRNPPPSASQTSDSSFEAELDYERYLDLPLPSDEPEPEEGGKEVDAGGYRAVGFSYGNDDEPAEERNVDGGLEVPGFRPSFPVPESLLHCLMLGAGRSSCDLRLPLSATLFPFDVMIKGLCRIRLYVPSFCNYQVSHSLIGYFLISFLLSLSFSQPLSEKLHQIIARTAMFVCKHGGQSEIILRVKQGDNPTFGFLMPDHHLHAYFKYLVDHQELLESEVDGNFQMEERQSNNEDNKSDAVGGALSLLGSVYGSAEDEDGATDDNPECNKTLSGEKVNTVSVVSQGSGRLESSAGTGEKDDAVSKHPLPSQKVKPSLIKKNPYVNASRAGSATTMKKEVGSSSFSAAVEKLKDSVVGKISKVEPLVVEPPSDIKRTIDKIVEFIAKNGKQFERTLIEQDSKHGRFPFLLPSNQYHPFYLKVLQQAQESKLSGRSFLSGKDDSAGHVAENKASLSAGSDMPLESDRKEKFKMVLGKTKKDGQDAHSKATLQEFGVTVDAAAAAAILQAAARGIKNPDLGIISSTFLNDKRSGQSSEVSLGDLPSSQPNNIDRKSDQNGERSASIPVAEEAAGEADSSEAHLTKDQRLKAERLKRAKMFVAMLKGGAAPGKTDQSRGSFVEPQASAVLGSGTEVNLSRKEREDSTVPPDDGDISDKNEKFERKLFSDEYNERRSKRKYRSRSGRPDEENEDEEEDDDTEKKPSRKKHRSPREDEHDEGKAPKEKDHKHSKRKKHHSHHSSHAVKDDEDKEEEKDRKRSRRKHRSRHSSEDDNDGKEDYESESYQKSSRRKHSSHRSSREEGDEEYSDKERHHKRSKKKHRSRSSSRRSKYDYKHRKRHSSRDKESRKEHKHDNSSDDEYLHRSRYLEQHKESPLEELEEGEIGIGSKFSDQSRGSGGGCVSREASLDIASSQHDTPSQPSEATDVSDDLRAKIRAMLMATR